MVFNATFNQSHGMIIMTNDDPLYFGKPNKCKTRISLIYVLGLPSIFSGVRVARSLVFCVVFYRSLVVLLSFFFLAIVLSVLLGFSGLLYRDCLSSEYAYNTL
jgi:hypothetical protein